MNKYILILCILFPLSSPIAAMKRSQELALPAEKIKRHRIEKPAALVQSTINGLSVALASIKPKKTALIQKTSKNIVSDSPIQIKKELEDESTEVNNAPQRSLNLSLQLKLPFFSIKKEVENNNASSSIADATTEIDHEETLNDHSSTQLALDKDLIDAVSACDNSRVKLLLTKGANVNAMYHGRTALFHAILLRAVEIVKILLEARADLSIGSEYQSIALHLAVAKEYEEIVRLLLDQGAEIDKKDNDGDTALHIAVNKGNTALVNLLLHYNASPNIRNNSRYSPLFLAIRNNNEGLVLILLQAGSYLYSWGDPVCQATINNNVHIVQLLLAVQKNNPYFHDRRLALREAVKRGNYEITKVLLEAGAEPNSIVQPGNDSNWKQQSPLHEAVILNKIEIAQLLLEHKANPNLPDHEGRTPFMYAAIKNNIELIILLGKYKPDITLRDVMGRTFYDYLASDLKEIYRESSKLQKK